MEIPKSIKGNDRKLWQRLFPTFAPKSEIEIEMAKRYIVWFQVFENAKASILQGNNVAAHGNRTVGIAPAMEVCAKAEGEMRRLYAQLSKSFAEPLEDDGEFSDL